MEIKDISVLVTGGGSGMGEATGRHLASLGARVALLDRNADAARAVAGDIDGLGVECDVTRAESVEQAVAEARAAHGPARLCVCCAGIATAGRIVGRDGPADLDAFRTVIEVNLIGTFNAWRVAAADMAGLEPANEDGERGLLVGTASVAAFEGQIGQAAYSASKGGVVGMTLPVARDLSGLGVRVMTIAPGLVQTPMLAGLPEEVQESLAAQVPFPKRLGRPHEYARLVEHIATNPMLNGETVRLDGAIRMQPR